MNKNFITYYAGEFGWELMTWQGHLRWLHHQFGFNFDVITREGREYIYEDFANKIYTYDFDGEPDCFRSRGMNERKFNNYLQSIKGDKIVFKPHNIGYQVSKPLHQAHGEFHHQVWVQYTSDVEMPNYDVIIHARSRKLAPYRNWGMDNWVELVERLRSDGLEVASIGRGDSSIHPFELSFGYPDCSMEETVALLNRAGVIVGESSGAIHLASLCGTPQIVWGSADNKIRYEHFWNPLQIECTFHGEDEWNPSVETIYNLIKKTL